MNNSSYKTEYMATLKTQVKLQTINQSANRSAPALAQYTSAISGKGYVPAKATKTKK